MSQLILSHEDVTGWPEALGSEFGFTGKVGTIRENNYLIGFYTICVDGESVQLHELEIIEEQQNKGYGAKFIAALFDKFPYVNSIKGLATEESEEFYATIGASIFESCFECSNADCGNNLISFHNNNNDSCCDDYSPHHFSLNRQDFSRHLETKLKQTA